jgi:hypothetical protein
MAAVSVGTLVCAGCGTRSRRDSSYTSLLLNLTTYALSTARNVADAQLIAS